MTKFNHWMEMTALSILTILAPIKAVIITVGVLIIMDLITGVIAAHKRGESVTSAGLRRSIYKMLAYQLAVISGFLVEKYLLEGILPVSKLVAGAIGLTEMKSLLENANSLTGTDLFKQVISGLGNKDKKE